VPPVYKTLQQFISDSVAAWAAELGLSPNLVSGDPLLAIMQGKALGGDIFLQSIAQQILEFARASTAKGVDLDSWMNDFDFGRLLPTSANGTVTFSLSQVQPQNVLIPAGVVIQTIGGAIKYQTIADTTRSGWSAAQQGYIITAGSLQVNATVQALSTGSASNLQAGQLNQFSSPIPSVATVTNTSPILNGLDAESDVAFRQRFILWINSRSLATKYAVLSAAFDVQEGLNVSVIENEDQHGNEEDGFFTVVVDDGSGNPPSSLLSQVAAAIDPVRPLTVEFTVVAPTLVNASISMNIRINPSALTANVMLNVTTAILDYVNSLLIGQSLYLNQLTRIAEDADPNVIAVQPGYPLLQSAQADLTASSYEVIRTNNTLVTIGTY
jgi:phage-related baseplate assembly protein